MSDHSINFALLIIGVITCLFEAGIAWMILQDYRKDREMPELSLKRLTILFILSLGPILALFVVYLFATNLRQHADTGNAPNGPWSWSAMPIAMAVAAIGYSIGRARQRPPAAESTRKVNTTFAQAKANAEINKNVQLSPRRYHQKVFTVQRVTADQPSTDPTVTYKDKIRMVLTNTTGRDIEAWTPIWESVEVFAQIPFGSRFRLEEKDGWKNGDWLKDAATGKVKEHCCLKVKAGSTVDCYIGLLPPPGQSIERRLQTHTSIGTAIFPVNIDGKLYEERVDL